MTIREILVSLNETEDEARWKWREIHDIYSIPTVVVQGPSLGSVIPSAGPRVSVNLGQVMVVKIFINEETGEIRTFIAKTITDLRERGALI